MPRVAYQLRQTWTGHAAMHQRSGHGNLPDDATEIARDARRRAPRRTAEQR